MKKYETTKIVDDDNSFDMCRDPQHNPPSHICIPQGQKMVHTCPSCGREIVVRPVCAIM